MWRDPPAGGALPSWYRSCVQPPNNIGTRIEKCPGARRRADCHQLPSPPAPPDDLGVRLIRDTGCAVCGFGCQSTDTECIVCGTWAEPPPTYWAQPLWKRLLVHCTGFWSLVCWVFAILSFIAQTWLPGIVYCIVAVGLAAFEMWVVSRESCSDRGEMWRQIPRCHSILPTSRDGGSDSLAVDYLTE